MTIDRGWVRAVVRKELRDYRRTRAIVVTMVILPCIFLIEPIIAVFFAPTTATGSGLTTYVNIPLIYMLLIPVMMPSTLAAYSVVGEREQGTLEPLLTTPIRREEFILGKAVSVMIPTIVLSYAVYGLFLLAVKLFARANVVTAVFHQGPILLSLFLLSPLLAGWSIVVGMAISVRAKEIRVAQQLGALASFPPLGLVVLLVIGVIHPTFEVAIIFAVGLLAIDARAVRIISRMFDRERLITGVKRA